MAMNIPVQQTTQQMVNFIDELESVHLISKLPGLLGPRASSSTSSSNSNSNNTPMMQRQLFSTAQLVFTHMLNAQT